MLRYPVYFMALCLFIQASTARTISLEDLLERIENLESWKSTTEKEIQALREVVAKQEAIIEEQARILESYVNDNTIAESGVEDSDADIAIHNENKVSRIESAMSPVRTIKSSRQRQHIRQIAGGVAFTAYLTHDINLGSKQTIKFDKVITNDGNGYNIHTGIFTCPEAGVYLFSFFLGERSSSDRYSEIFAELVVNNNIIVAGAAETHHIREDAQGGNMAVVRLSLGDAIWVETMVDRHHVEGSSDFRLTTFTGVYLYA